MGYQVTMTFERPPLTFMTFLLVAKEDRTLSSKGPRSLACHGAQRAEGIKRKVRLVHPKLNETLQGRTPYQLQVEYVWHYQGEHVTRGPPTSGPYIGGSSMHGNTGSSSHEVRYTFV